MDKSGNHFFDNIFRNTMFIHNRKFGIILKSITRTFIWVLNHWDLLKLRMIFLTKNWFLAEKMSVFGGIFGSVREHNEGNYFLRYWRRFKMYFHIDFLIYYHPLVYLLKTQTLTKECNVGNGNAINALFHLYQVHIKRNCAFYCPNLNFIAIIANTESLLQIELPI